MDDMIKNWDFLLPLTFYYEHFPTEQQKRITEELNEFYFHNEPFLESNRQNLTNVGFKEFPVGERLFISSLLSALERWLFHRRLRES